MAYLDNVGNCEDDCTMADSQVGGSDEVELRWRGVLPDIGLERMRRSAVVSSLTRSCDLLMCQKEPIIFIIIESVSDYARQVDT